MSARAVRRGRSAPGPRSRSTTTGRTAQRSPSPWRGCAPPTRPAGSGRSSSNPAGRVGPVSGSSKASAISCSHGRAGPLRHRRLRPARDRVLADPVRLPDGRWVTYQVLVSTTLGSMYGPGSWPQLARSSRPSTRPTGLTATVLAQLRADGVARPASGPAYRQVVEGFAGVWCIDGDNPALPRYWASPREARTGAFPTSGARGSGVEHLRRVARSGHRPLHRAVHRAGRERRARRGQPQRPGDALSGRAEHCGDASRRPTAGGERPGPHVAVHLVLRRQLHGDLPDHCHASAARGRLRGRPHSLQRRLGRVHTELCDSKSNRSAN